MSFPLFFFTFYWSRLHRDDRYDRRISKRKSFSPVRLFIKTFRQFWLKGFFYWLFAWIVSVIMIFDCFFFIRFSYGKWLIPLFVLLACLSVSFSINCWYFQVRNPASKPNQVLRIAFYYTLKNGM